MLNKLLSAIIIVAYIITASIIRGKEGFLRTLLFVALPFILIWFGDGYETPTGDDFTGQSPGWALKFMGWLILLIPLALILFGRWNPYD